jgi:hypothetical protein
MMVVFGKILLSFGALLLGPAFIVLSNPFHRWSVSGGLMTMTAVSGMAVYGIWRKQQRSDRIWLFIFRCWHGEERLWKIFWLVGAGTTAANWAMSYAGTQYKVPIIWWIILLVLGVLVEVWWIVSVWRCSKNANKKIWSLLSKSVIVISGLYYAYLIFLVVAYPFGI